MKMKVRAIRAGSPISSNVYYFEVGSKDLLSIEFLKNDLGNNVARLVYKDNIRDIDGHRVHDTYYYTD